MRKEDKSKLIEQLHAELKDAQAAYLTGFSGLTVGEMNALRVEFKKQGVSYRVVKNTLARKALEGTPLEELSKLFQGPTALAYTTDDPVVPAKIIKNFMKDNEKLEFKGGYLDGEVFGPDALERIASLPSRDDLRATLLSVIVGVPRGIVTLMHEVPAGLVRVLDARREQLDKGEEAA